MAWESGKKERGCLAGKREAIMEGPAKGHGAAKQRAIGKLWGVVRETKCRRLRVGTQEESERGDKESKQSELEGKWTDESRTAQGVERVKPRFR